MEQELIKPTESSNFLAKESKKVTKAIIPIAGLGTRFLPITKIVPKEFLPLVDKPMIQYIVEEAERAGIEKVIFITKPGEKNILKYFKKSQKLEKNLKEQKKESLLPSLKKLNNLSKKISFSAVVQDKPLGDGHAVLQAKKFMGKESVAVLFVDDIFDSKIPCISQLLQVFKTCQKPVIGLKRVAEDKLYHYGIVGVEKISHRLYKIKKIIEKPSQEQAPFYPVRGFGSNGAGLAIVGRYILTPEVFEYLRKAKPVFRGEIILADIFSKMIDDGKVIYGYEIEGKWLECGDKARWLKSSLHLSLNHPEYGPELKNIF